MYNREATNYVKGEEIMADFLEITMCQTLRVHFVCTDMMARSPWHRVAGSGGNYLISYITYRRFFGFLLKRQEMLSIAKRGIVLVHVSVLPWASSR